MLQCCFGVKQREDREDDQYRKITEEDSNLLNGARPLGSKYSSVEEFLNHRKSFHEDAINLWTNPDDVSHSIEEDDRALYTLLQEKDSCKDSQRREQCEVEIQRIRGERETTLQRWKRVLVDLGFDREADKLLAVHTTVHSGDQSNVEGSQASSLHHRLVEESDIFGQRSTQAVRYTAVLERLLDLDIADSFVTMAIREYPKQL